MIPTFAIHHAAKLPYVIPILVNPKILRIIFPITSKNIYNIYFINFTIDLKYKNRDKFSL